MPSPQPQSVLGPRTWPVRTLRGAAAALVVTALAAGAHLTAGGQARPEVLLAVLVGAWLVSAALASRRLTTAQLVGLLVLGQVVVHALSPSAPAGHDLPMLLAHVVGTAVSTWVLRRGEDTLSTVADRLVLRFATPLAAGLPAPVHVAAVTVAWAPTGSRRIHDAEERGPPVGAR